MRYAALWFGIFSAAALGSLVIAGLVVLASIVIDQGLWWVPALLVMAALVATLALSIEIYTDRNGAEE